MFLRFDDGFFDYYDVTVPFNGVEQPHMHGVLVLAIFGFCVVLAQFVGRAQAVAGGADGDRRRRLARDALSGGERRLRRR